MLTFEPAFRTLLLTKIRGLTNEQLTAYEGLVAMQLELQQRKKLDPENLKLQKQIDRTGQLAYEAIKPYEREFNDLYDRWLARRRKALQRGNYFQFPFNSLINLLRKFICYCSTRWWNYRKGRKLTTKYSKPRRHEV